MLVLWENNPKVVHSSVSDALWPICYREDSRVQTLVCSWNAMRPDCTESKNTFQRNNLTFTFTNTSLQQFPSLNVRTSMRENLVCTPTTGCVIRLLSCFLYVCTQLHAKCEAGKKTHQEPSFLLFLGDLALCQAPTQTSTAVCIGNPRLSMKIIPVFIFLSDNRSAFHSEQVSHS